MSSRGRSSASRRHLSPRSFFVLIRQASHKQEGPSQEMARTQRSETGYGLGSPMESISDLLAFISSALCTDKAAHETLM